MSIYDKSSLVLIPSGTKSGKVFSQKPVNGDGDFTFSRSTAATRVNADGNIEKETQNLLLQSNTFDTSWGNVFSSNPTGGQSGYDGSNDAWLLSSVSGSASRIYQNTSSGVDVNSLSVYAKANTLTWARLQISTASGNYVSDFDLINGVSGYTFNSPLPSIESIGNGWYRIKITAFDTSTQLRIYAATGDNDLSGAGNIYIQDAQLEQGLVARDYIETTTAAVEGGITDNVPRLDYTDSSCPALLLEPQRTNVLPLSEYYGGALWVRTRCGFITNTDETLSPEGVYNASKMVSNDAAESYAQDEGSISGTLATLSFFAKKGDTDFVHGTIWDNSANGCRQWFNVNTGATGGDTAFGSGYSVVSGSGKIESFENGWYRCSFTANVTTGTNAFRINLSSANETTGSPVDAYGYFYGVQAESGSYATSYIPTYGTSVTRNNETCEITGVADLIGQEQGSIYWDVNFIDNGGYPAIFVYDGTSNNRLLFQRRGNNQVMQSQVRALNALQADYLTSSAISNGNHKMALAYATNDFQSYLDGASAGSDSSGITYTNQLTQISLKPNEASIRINQVLIFKTRLSNEELADLTTL